eukprot:m.113457 g.113457  ORF g.113457 m.113457 type:complete len:382 (-) comp16002_c0_seq2:435-1580(-)
MKEMNLETAAAASERRDSKRPMTESYYIAKLAENAERIRKLEKENSDWQEQMQLQQEAFNTQIAAASQNDHELKDLRSQHRKLREELRQLRAQLAAVTEEKDNALRLAREREDCLTQAQNESVQLVSDLQTLQELSAQAEQLRQQAETAETALRRAQQQLAGNADTIRDQTARLATMSNTVAKLKRELDEATAYKADAEKTKNDLKMALKEKDSVIEEKEEFIRKLRRQCLEQRKTDQATIDALTAKIAAGPTQPAEPGKDRAAMSSLRAEAAQLHQARTDLLAKLNAAEARAFDFEATTVTLQIEKDRLQQEKLQEQEELKRVDPKGKWSSTKRAELVKTLISREEDVDRLRDYVQRVTSVILDKAPDLLQDVHRMKPKV